MIPQFPIYIRASLQSDYIVRARDASTAAEGERGWATAYAFLLLPRMTRRNTSFARGPPPRRARGRYLKFRAACCSGNGRSDNGALRPTDGRTDDARRRKCSRVPTSPDALLPQLPEMSTQRSGDPQSVLPVRVRPGAGAKRADPMHSMRIN